jgi:hypothetical protein
MLVIHGQFTGTSTGAGSGLTQPVDVGYGPIAAIIVKVPLQIPSIRLSTMTGDKTKPMIGSTATFTGGITSILATSFVVGDDPRVNDESGTDEIDWIAFIEDAADCKAVAYTGASGADNRQIACGFVPTVSLVFPETASNLYYRQSTMAAQVAAGDLTSMQLSGTAVSDRIQAEHGSDGVIVGANLNTNAVAFHGLFLKDDAGVFKAYTYTGTGANHDTAGGGFLPNGGWVTKFTAQGMHKFPDLAGTISTFFSASADNASTGIRGFHADGLSVGTLAGVNANGVAHHAVAFAATPAGAIASGDSSDDQLLVLGVS